MCPMDYPDVPRIKQIDTLIQGNNPCLLFSSLALKRP